jgi:hypothetical protein
VLPSRTAGPARSPGDLVTLGLTVQVSNSVPHDLAVQGLVHRGLLGDALVAFSRECG